MRPCQAAPAFETRMSRPPKAAAILSNAAATDPASVTSHSTGSAVAFIAFVCSRAAVKIMLAQGTGGCLLFNVSKQAVNPGPNFGPYGIPKAAALALMRQYALDYGWDGIRANAVNADRIRSGLLTNEMIASRSKARGVSEKDYMSGNLLGREVTAEDVAQAFLHHALALKTTADVTTVDGGNIAAAMR